MRRRIGDILEELKGVIQDHDLKVSDELLFQETLKLYHGEQKDKSSKSTSSPTQPSPENDTSITHKQKYFIDKNKDKLKSLGFKLNNIKTKLEASKVIESFKKSEEEPDKE